MDTGLTPTASSHALPGCDHLDWSTTTQYATWTSPPGEDPEELPLRQAEVATQGLVMVGDPHLCQTDPDDGRELWAVELSPAG